MKFPKFILVLTFLSQLTFASPFISFATVANDSVEKVWTQLFASGLQRWDAYHPLLPRPKVPAKFALVDSSRRILAYYDEEVGVGGSTYVFKNTRGEFRHSVSFSWNSIQYTLPTYGKVAFGNQWIAGNGPSYLFQCKGHLVSFYYFQNCLRNTWISAIVSQISQFN